MTFEEYIAEGYMKYAAFAEAVARILGAAISEKEPPIHAQPVQHRPKSVESLRDKILTRKKLDPIKIEDDIKDLAGCRVVFYNNGDVSKFLNSGILRDNFDIDPLRTKLHHPVKGRGSTAETSEFRSANIVVTLNDARTTLPEYARFKGMRCEIQIQTILDHSWAETSHDITYKKQKFSGFGTRLLADIEQRLTKISREYLLPAGYEFQNVHDDFQGLLKGKELLDTNAVDRLVTLDDNSERLSLIQSIGDHLLPHLDDHAKDYPAIRAKFTASMRVAVELPLKPPSNEAGSHKLQRFTVDMYLERVLTYLHRYRLVDIDHTLDDIFALHAIVQTEHRQQKVAEAAKRMASHDLGLWRKYGPYIEKAVAARLNKIPPAEYLKHRQIVLALSDGLLSPDVSGTNGNYKTVTFTTAAVVPSDAMRTIRRETIDRLIAMYRQVPDEGGKVKIKAILSGAMQKPQHGNYQDELLRDIISDGAYIAEFYVSIAACEKFEILQAIENTLMWWHRRTADILPPKVTDTEILDAKARLDAGIAAFRTIIDANSQYIVHKTLVGFDSVFPLHWDNDKGMGEYQVTKAYRENVIDSYIADISPTRADHWFAIIERCLETRSNDHATFMYFGPFLRKIGRDKTDVALDYIGRLQPDTRLATIATDLLAGIRETSRAGDADAVIDRWLGERRFLPEVAHLLTQTPPVDVPRLTILARAAIETDNLYLVRSVFSAAFKADRDTAAAAEEQVIRPCLEYFLARKDGAWPDSIWYLKGTWVMPHLADATIKLMLESLVYRRSIDTHAEWLLIEPSKTHPEYVADMFAARIEVAADITDVESEYDAIPFEMHDLAAAMAMHPAVILKRARAVYDNGQDNTKYYAVHLIHSVFPDFPDAIATYLEDLIAGKQDNDIGFLLELLAQYRGLSKLNPICRQIVDALPIGDQRLEDVKSVFEATGTLTGEFGYVKMLQNRKTRIAPWLTDPSESVRKFAAEFIHQLDNGIAQAQQRAEWDIAAMKHMYGDDGSADPEIDGGGEGVEED